MADDLFGPDEPVDATLRADAWCGEPAQGTPAGNVARWSLRSPSSYRGGKLAPESVDPANWQHPEVGWGVVLPDRDDVPVGERARGDDAPEPIRQLIEERGNAPVFRYRADLGDAQLRWYDAQGAAFDLGFAGGRGMAPDQNQIPAYLLVVGSPQEIPWSAQLRLQLDFRVGRLDLDTAGLAHYVAALRNDWKDARRNTAKPLVWAVDHGHPDITRLMRKVIAEKMALALGGDAEFDMADGFLVDGQATGEGLAEALAARRPAFVLTSSHGATFPFDDTARMAAQLGLLVDARKTVTPAEAIATDAAHGAVWYAHACCSVGSDGASQFTGLVQPGTTLSDTLLAVERCGSMTGPLPRRLLGSETPVRAFVGHVEPTFNWTLRSPDNGQAIAHHIVRALYHQLHLAARPPIGLAMATYYANVAGFLQDHTREVDAVNRSVPGALDRALRAKLIAMDRLATVILGDPTVALPKAS
jgi:hypothetical protein